MLFGCGGGGGDDDDSYLLKTPGRVTAAAAGHEKASKRVSMRSTHSVYSVYSSTHKCSVYSSRIPPHKDKDQSMFHVL